MLKRLDIELNSEVEADAWIITIEKGIVKVVININM